MRMWVLWAVAALNTSTSVARVETPSLAGQAWTWTRLLTSGIKPAARAGHAAVEVDGKVFVIGGCILDVQCFNDVHVFDPRSTEWSSIALVGGAPEPRGGHSATRVGASIFVFGGASSEQTFSDVYELDLIARRWSRGTAVRSRGAPAARTNHAADTDGKGRILLFGGYGSDGQYLDDLWVLNVFYDGDWVDSSTVPVIWEQPVAVGPTPAAREGHSLTIVQDRAYVFGGYTVAGLLPADLHVLALSEMRWVPPNLVDPMPAPRQNHAMARHGSELVLVGGCTVAHPGHCFADAWTLDVESLSWQARSWDETTLAPREGHTATFVRGDLVVVAGCDLAHCFNDVTSLASGEPCPDKCGHGSCEAETAVEATPPQSFCRCAAGFTGHDCQEPVTCPFGCHGRGQCQSTGRCTCNNGFGGPSCQLQFPCPVGPGPEDEAQPCGGNGKCLASGTCECFPGFSGLGCGTGTPKCLNGCSGHGTCSPESKCTCAIGWHGEDCSVADTCPLACCKHGTCGETECLCAKGWHGPACNLAEASWNLLGELSTQHVAQLRADAESKRRQAHDTLQVAQLLTDSAGAAGNPDAATKAAALKLSAQQTLNDVTLVEQEADAMEKDRTKGQSLVDASTCAPEINSAVGTAGTSPLQLAGVFQMVSTPTHAPTVLAATEGMIKAVPGQAVPKLSSKAFGVEGANDVTAAEDAAEQCPGLQNCNFHGICRNEVCYCEPSFYGPTCSQSRAKRAGTLPLEMVILIAGGSVVGSFMLTMGYMQWVAMSRRRKEQEMGFNI